MAIFFDATGTLASLLSTYYFIRQDKKAWAISLIAILLNGWLYWQKEIYGDLGLEGCYFFMTCYGWFNWKNNFKPSTKKIDLKYSHYFLIGITSILLFLTIFTLLRYGTNSKIPGLDALTTTLSLLAQWLMCRKLIATWVFWGFTDILYAYLYFHKELIFHFLLMLGYLIMAAIGYYSWIKKTPYRNFLK